MKTLADFLTERLEAGFSTEDALAALLPLMRQVVDTHTARMVAPLEGLSSLRVEGAAIWFEDSARKPLAVNFDRIRPIDSPAKGAIEVVAEHRRTLEVGEGVSRHSDLRIGEPGEEPARPVYLPGYVGWEHALNHHDPLSDVFSLGMLLASLACALDFRDPEDLERFVSHRENLFALCPALHPVLAKAITGMTELSRHRRPQDLRALIRSLENYREQDAGFEFDLKSVRGFGEKDPRGRKEIILGRLRERLFEISRRNRLLHFRDTSGTVCLTEASVPLSMHVESMQPGQILTWGGRFRDDIVSGKPVPMNRYVNVREALYFEPAMDRIRTEALRDEAEFGFQQLRLVICFLRWADVKAKPPELYYSPLVLLPATLTRKKGIRDTYILEPLDTTAEINPVLRHLLQQLYGIGLPETLDLAETDLEALFEALKTRIAASDASVNLEKIERPRIDLVHERARRRLDMYRRRIRLSGRSVRRFMDLDYSYDPVNFHPLGLRIFNAWVRPSETHLARILEERPRPRHFAVAPVEPGPEFKEKSFYALRDGESGNPYRWEFDLCRVTLGNFHYRKMTLVRDYAELLACPPANAAFDAAFSLRPRPVDIGEPAAPPLEERFDIVTSDPTQAAAIQVAREGGSYIIQGPPGTGKSQTITNLVADYVARGKRVLFVCEKRAAIDVVYSRLKQRGLKELCCLIHDSQADKRAFVEDLKQTYESFVQAAREGHHRFARRRACLDGVLDDEAEALEAFAESMAGAPSEAGLPCQALLCRGAELGVAPPELSAAELARVPFYSHWSANRDRIGAFLGNLSLIREDRVLGRHPFRLLRPGLKDSERPAESVLAALDAATPLLENLVGALDGAGVPPALRGSLVKAAETVSFAAAAETLARQRLMSVLNARGEPARRLAAHRSVCEGARAAVEAAALETLNWRGKLSLSEARLALAEARRLETAFLAFLKPAWWRLRRVLNERYHFGAHVVRPPWSRVIENLVGEYEAVEAHRKAVDEMKRACGITGDLAETLACADRMGRLAGTEMGAERLRHLLGRPDPDQAALDLARRANDLGRLADILAGVLQDHGEESPESLLRQFGAMRGAMGELGGFLRCLSDLEAMPPDLAGAFRHLALEPAEMEAASVRRTLDSIYRNDHKLRTFDAHRRHTISRRLVTAHRKWLELNAQLVKEQVRGRFLANVRLASEAAAHLTCEQAEFKKRYNKGRRDLEHEFGKTMRYRAIRDLVSGDSGLVIDDLKPIWLMSPLSVSDTLPLDGGRFDVVIFDEASQITLEEAVPALFRSGQAIVVGDEMQLPPTNFFSAKQSEEESVFSVEEDEETVEYDLGVNSFLTHAAKNLPSRMLGWHYRSRSESLIGFSNWAFYQGRLLTVPEEELSPARRPEIVFRTAPEGEANSREVLRRPVSFHRAEGSVYRERCNRMEADYIAHLVRALLKAESRPSLGIVAFSEAQQGEIEDALDRLSREDPTFSEQLEAELTREEDGQFVGLLVKNLENIQGDERDIIVMSVCYGPGPDGRIRMNFGPINQSGGEKRLNVAFSRARHHMALVSSLRAGDITNDYNDGANCLKNYLRYAAACSVGDAEGARRVLHDLCLWRDPAELARAARPGPLARQIGQELVRAGYAVNYNVGMSDFRCDLAVRHGEETVYRLGVLVDADPAYWRGDLLEREVFKPRLLTDFGWKIARVLAKDWYEDREKTLGRLLAMAAGEQPPEGIEPDPDFDRALDDRVAQADEADPPGGASAPENAPPAGVLDLRENATRYFEFVGGVSRKFWEITLAGNRFSVHFGRLGTAGQEQVKAFEDAESARRAAVRMVSEKLGKGYEEKPRPAAKRI